MRKLTSLLIIIMMTLSLIPYTAFAEAGSEGTNPSEIETIAKEMVIGESEEVTLELLVNTKVTVESDDSGSAYGILTGSSLIISDGIALYCSTIEIMPTRIGAATLTVKSNGEVVRIYNINVKPSEQTTKIHIGQKETFEYVSHYDEEITNTNLKQVEATVVSKNQRNTTATVNGVLITAVLYVYKIEVEYKEVGTANFSLVGSKSGEFCKVTSEVMEHDYEWVIDIPATIEAPGKMHEACEFCGAIRNAGTVIEQLNHVHIIIEVPGVDATCSEDGVTGHFTCETCDKVYSDAAGDNLIALDDVILPAKGHEFEWVVDVEPTEDAEGIKHEECFACGLVRSENTTIEQLTHSHNMVRTVGRAATCESDGNIEFFGCTICRNLFTDVTGEHSIDPEDTIIKATGHNYSEWQMMNPSSCIRKGYEFASCMKCGRPEIKETPLKPHMLKHSVTEPTCNADGANVTSCEKCRYKVVDVIPATGHKEQKVTALPATCTKDGHTDGTKCTVCNEYIDVPESIPATGHRYDEWIVDTFPTCDSYGSKHRDCFKCGVRETAKIDKSAHDTIVVPAVAATCTATGLTEGLFCTACGNVLMQQETIAKQDHKWNAEYTVDKRASIKNGGSMSRHCADCNAVNKDTVKKIYMIKKTTVAATEYNGLSRKPAVTVVDNAGHLLQSGKDFTVAYKNAAGTKSVKPQNVGKYKAVVTFRGNYSGSVTKEFKIAPKATIIKSLTKGNKQFTVKWNRRTDQVTGYQIKYSKKSDMGDSSFILVKNNKTVSKTIKNLKAQKKYWVQVRTYKTVNGVKYWSKWSTKKSVVTN